MKKIALFIILTTVLLFGLMTFIATTRWSSSRSIIKADGLIYFLYAQSIILDFDTDLTNNFKSAESHLNEATIKPVLPYMQVDPVKERIAFPFPIGAGLLMSPFYGVGFTLEYIVSFIKSRPVSPYGSIPVFCFGVGAIVYGLIGFYYMSRMCAGVANKKIAYTSAMAISLAGLLVFYVFFHPTMAHAPSFAVASIFFFAWWRSWHEGTNRIVGLMFLWGVLVIIRYQNIMFGILVIIIFLANIKQLLLKDALRDLVAGLGAFAIPFSLQAFHWIGVNGFLFKNGVAYGEGGHLIVEQNTMNFMSPHFLNVLFSCQHGLFYWTPIYLLGFVGLVWACRKEKWAWAFLAVILGHVYLIGCLDSLYNWSGGGLYGMRYLTECSPLMAVGLAVLIKDMVKVVKIQWWWAMISILIVWNGMLIFVFSLKRISQHDCVTLTEMASAMVGSINTIIKHF